MLIIEHIYKICCEDNGKLGNAVNKLLLYIKKVGVGCRNPAS
jgi:hypothetical protein